MSEKMATNLAHRPCWKRDTREKTITKIASLGEDSRDRFLATHSPITNLEKTDHQEKVGEEIAFQEIIDFSKKEATVVVKGAPGTGKSHFINWLKLRCDYEQRDEKLKNTTVVLIQRRTGSLKDTLEQLIEQLPKELQIYLDPVRSAVTALSNEELKTRLAQSISNHFVHRAGDNFLPRNIKSLPQAFIAEGFGSWLTREGGAIDRNVKLLTSNSEVNERSATPQFTPQDFVIEDPKLRHEDENSGYVLSLLDEIEEYEDEVISLLVEKSNAVLRNSVQELLGLNNTALTDIFNNIRRDLKKSNQKLILLIEDVSTLSVLDHEIVNAVEPNNDNSLCPITSVLGMTEGAYTGLRDNQKQRLSLVLSLPEDPSDWASDTGSTDQFLARYLNAIRMTDDQVSGLVSNMQGQQKLTDSACTDCTHKNICFTKFGSVEIDEVSIGLYPFRNKSANELLKRIDEKNIYGKTQRGLIEEIINPTLLYFEKVDDGKKQRLALNVSISYPSYFQELRDRFLNGWESRDVELFNYLSNVWSQENGLNEVISDIQPLLPFFSLPEYSEKVDSPNQPKPKQKQKEVLKPESIETQQPIINIDRDEAGYEKENNKLNKWFIEETDFPAPQKMQSLIVDFIETSLSVYNYAETQPLQAFNRTLNFTNDMVRMEGMSTRAVATMLKPYELKRTKETNDFLDALLRFGFYGKKSWDFENGEKYKRVAYSWFRRNRDEIINVFAAKDQNQSTLDELEPLKQAVRLLFLLKSADYGETLPINPIKRLDLLFSPIENFKPSALSEKMLALHQDLEAFATTLNKFVLSELNQSQGGASTVKIIDPTPIFEILADDEELFSITELHEGFFKGPSKNRYSDLRRFKQWAKLPKALDDELSEVKELIKKIDRILTKWGFVHTTDYANLTDWYQDLSEVFDAIRDVLKTPFHDLKVWYIDQTMFPATETATMLSEINKLIEAENSNQLLYFDTGKLRDFYNFIFKIDELLCNEETRLDDRNLNKTNVDAPSKYLEKILDDLTYVSAGAIS